MKKNIMCLISIFLFCSATKCAAQKKYFPLMNKNIETYDTLIISLNDIDNYITIDFYEDELIDSLKVDTFNVQIIFDKKQIIKNENIFSVSYKYRDCSSISTPYYHVRIYGNGNELNRFAYCYSEQINWGTLVNYRKQAVLKFLVYSIESSFNTKLNSLNKTNTKILLKPIIKNNRFIIRYFELH